MIILDFETNSANIHDVIEVAAFKVELIDNEYGVPLEIGRGSCRERVFRAV